MKRLLITVGLCLLPLCFFAQSEAADGDAGTVLKTLDLAAWDRWFQSQAPELGFSPSDFAYEIADASLSDGDALFDAVRALFRQNRKSAFGKCALYVGLAVLAAAQRGLAPSSPIAETSTVAFRAAAASAVLISVAAELRTAAHALSLANDTSEVLLPILLGVLTLGGMENSAAALSASFSLYTSAAIRVMQGVVVPLACVGGVFCAMDASETARLSALGRLLLRASKWVLGVIAALFGLFGTVRGAAAASADGYLLRTVKLTAGSFPVVGGMVSGSAEAVYQCLLLVKNAVGLTGLTLILLLAAKPVASLFLSRCALRCARALSEPLAGRTYSDLLHALSDTLQVFLLTEIAAFGLLALAAVPMLRIGGGL